MVIVIMLRPKGGKSAINIKSALFHQSGDSWMYVPIPKALRKHHRLPWAHLLLGTPNCPLNQDPYLI